MNDLVTRMTEVRNGYQITVNDTDTFHLSKAEMRELPLREGQSLDWAEYQKSLLLIQYPDALNRAVRLLAIRPRSRREVERALQLRGCLPDTVEMVIYKLEKEKLLDDAEFASVWAQARSRLGIGRARIRQELRMKGVDSATAETALTGLDSEAEDQQTLAVAEKLLRRYHSLTPSDAIRKALPGMQRRGYAYGDAYRALKAVMARLSEEENPS
jgi:regulatory protein